MNPVKMSCHVKIVWSCTGKHQSGKNYAPVSPEYVPMYADQAAVKTAYLCLFFLNTETCNGTDASTTKC